MVTSKDIAEHTGFSLSTVTKVIRGGSRQYKIKPETERIIMDAAARLGYRPNLMARSLVTRKTYVVGLLYRKITEQAHAERIGEIQSCLTEHGYGSIISGWDANTKSFNNGYDTLISRGVDGIICAHHETEHLSTSVPTILHFYQNSKFDSVSYDFKNAIQRALSYLHELGHTRIGFLGNNRAGWPYHEFLQFNNHDESYSFFDNDSIRVGELGVVHFMKMDKRPTAVISQNDTLGIRFIASALRAGWKVPEQLSVIGFNNITAAALNYPSLTTFDSSIAQSARLLVDMLLTRIQQPDLPVRQVVLEQEMLIRESCAVCHER